ncbi:MAG: hypothetical protein WDW36_009285 [Sanguina aurantia]
MRYSTSARRASPQSVLDIFSPPTAQPPQQAPVQEKAVSQIVKEPPPSPVSTTAPLFVVKDPVQAAITGSATVVQEPAHPPQSYSSYVGGDAVTQESSSTPTTTTTSSSSSSTTDTQLKSLEESYSLESSKASEPAVQEKAVVFGAERIAAERAAQAAEIEKMVQEARAREESRAASTSDMELTVSLARSIDKATAAEWDALANSGGEVNPFLSWAFLHALETSGSVSTGTGWMPQHLLARDGKGNLVGACPLYLKSHSYGEYVFDNSWASASARMGIDYYPKLQSCVPFTPVTGQRILVQEGPLKSAIVETMASAMVQITAQLQVSGLHMTFNTAEESATLARMGFMQRTGIQFHWENRGYKTFEDFLADLKQSKRKCIRQERKSMEKQGLSIRRLRGGAIDRATWDLFYDFYNDTVDKKWGTAYLSREFFHKIGATMPQQVLLVIAEERGVVVAAALNLVGSHAIYGRNWGCAPGREFKNLHFELCYYQAIEEAIVCGLSRVEAGAQGEHKMQRGYLPSFTHSVHYLTDPQLRGAVSSFLERERQQIEYSWQALSVESSPFKAETTYAAMVSKMVEYEDMRQSSIPKGRGKGGGGAPERPSEPGASSSRSSSSSSSRSSSSSSSSSSSPPEAESSTSSGEYTDDDSHPSSSSGDDSYDASAGYENSEDGGEVSTPGGAAGTGAAGTRSSRGGATEQQAGSPGGAAAVESGAEVAPRKEAE